MFSGAKLKSLRENKNITTAELAEELAVSQSFISSIENNVKLPNANLVEIMADFFGIPLSGLYVPRENENNDADGVS